MWFRHREQAIHTNEFELLSKKLIELSTTLGLLDAKVKILETNLDNLRGNINSRLLRRFKKEEEEEKEESKTINNPVILPYDGSFK